VLFGRISRHPLLASNSQEVNVLLFLGIFTLVVFVVDINSELALEKNEIEYIVGVLHNSNESVTLADLSSIIFHLDTEGIILPYNTPIQTNDVLSLPRNRAPPIVTPI
jgi:hypothetical protein